MFLCNLMPLTGIGICSRKSKEINIQDYKPFEKNKIFFHRRISGKNFS